MNRRHFLRTSLYASLLLSFKGFAKSVGRKVFLLPPKPINRQLGVLNIRPSQLQLDAYPPIKAWLYQDAQGGSLLDVTLGEMVQLTVNNQLPEPTTVHWHGLDIPPAQDGLPHHPIAPNQSVSYAFTPPQAGTYWYHPHPHGRTAAQAARGLAAPIVVRDPNDPIAALGIEEHVLLFTSLQLDASGQIALHTMSEQMNGREGNTLLINGQLQPTLEVMSGKTYRLRLINASNARYLRLAFNNIDMIVVGTDGGLLESPLPAQKELLIAPAERYEVCVTFNANAVLQVLPYDKGWMSDGMGGQKPVQNTLDALLVNVTGQASLSPALPKTLRSIKPLGDAKITRRMVLTEKMSMSMENGQHHMNMAFMINNQVFDMNRTDFNAHVDEVELWEIVNQTDMDHPFHIHGSHFQIVSIDDQPFPYLAWKDTVNTRSQQTVRIKIAQRHKGLRMFHCHVLEHEDLGMMGQYEVI